MPHDPVLTLRQSSRHSAAKACASTSAAIFVALLALLYAPLLAAACLAPNGREGEMLYNSDYAVMQFCDGANWISMAATMAANEIDPKIGSLDAGHFCRSNAGATAIQCTTATIDLASDVSGSLPTTSLSGTISNAQLAGSIALPKLAATGTADATTFLRGDGTWAAVASSLPTLTAANLWIGNGSNVATAVTLSGDATLAWSGALAIASNAVTTSKIADANVTLAKLATTGTANTSGFLRGDGTWTASLNGTLTATTFSGSGASLTSLPGGNLTGTLPAISGANLISLNASNLASGTVATSRMGSGTANAATYLRGDGTWAAVASSLPTLTAANLWIGSGSNVATAVTLSGDATLASSGALTIASNAVTTSKIADANVTLAKLATTGTANTSGFLRGDGTWTASLNGTLTATTFSGSGASLTSLPGGNLTGTLPAISGANLISLNASNLASGTVATSRMGSGTANAATYLRGDGTWAAPSGGGVSADTTVTCSASNNGATCTTAACPAGYFRSGCSAHASVVGQPVHAWPSGGSCACRQGAAGGGTITCYAYCMQ